MTGHRIFPHAQVPLQSFNSKLGTRNQECYTAVPPVHASGKGYVSESRQKNSRRNQPTVVCRSPELDGVALRAIVKIAMRAMISRYRLPQIVAPVWVHRFICLLGLAPCARQIFIGDSRDDFISHNRFYCRPANVNFRSVVMRRPDNGFSGYFRLKEWRNRLRLIGQSAFDRDASIRERGADLHDRAPVPGQTCASVPRVFHKQHRDKVTSVTRLNSCAVISLIGEKPDVIALLTQMSMDPRFFGSKIFLRAALIID